MRRVSLEEIADATGGKLSGDATGVEVSCVNTDSRDLDPGGVFFALTGPRFDGHSFLEDVRRSGVKAAVVRRGRPLAREFASRHPSYPLVLVRDTAVALGDLAALVRSGLDLEVVGVTGTTGKTSTKDMLASILSVDRAVASSSGSYNNEIGLPLTIFSAGAADDLLVAEMGARRPGDVLRLCEIARPKYGIVTNVGAGHLEVFKTLDAVARTKGELARCLPAEGCLFLNAGDVLVRKMARHSKAEVVFFGDGEGSRYTAFDVRLDARARASFRLLGPDMSIEVGLAVSGRHQVENALAAAACAHTLGSSANAIKKGLETSRVSKWRTECLDSAYGFTIINDSYNSNPESMKAALATLVEASAGRRTVAVLGCMGELGKDSRDFHALAGSQAASGKIDIVVTVGRKAGDIAAGALRAGLPRGSAFRCDDIEEALGVLACVLEPDDIVLVKASRSVGFEALADALASPAFKDGKPVTNV